MAQVNGYADTQVSGTSEASHPCVSVEAGSRGGDLSRARRCWTNNLWVPLALLVGIIVGLIIPAHSEFKGTAFEAKISQVLGWTYFFAWSTSFYPQVVLNYQRRSVHGLSCDYQMLNAVGFACYFIFNIMLFCSSAVQEEYAHAHNGSSSAVQLNDVVFAGHAFLLTSITLCQIAVYYDYPPLKKEDLLLRRAVVIILSVFIVVAVAIAVVIIATKEGALDWLTYISILAQAKVAISVVKYCPQVWMNYKRKSTVGWNIHNVLLDFSGGALSVAQLLYDAWVENDWGKVSGDPAKLLLGNLSIFFDVIFMAQHYCLYRAPRHHPTTEPLSLSTL